MNKQDKSNMDLSIVDLKGMFKEGRYALYGNYKFDRYIFKTMMFFILALLFLIAYSYDFELDYLKCETSPYVTPLITIDQHYSLIQEEEQLCKNPFYEPASWKNQEYLPEGEYGVNPTGWLKTIMWVIFFAFLFAFLANHLMHNIGNKPPVILRCQK